MPWCHREIPAGKFNIASSRAWALSCAAAEAYCRACLSPNYDPAPMRAYGGRPSYDLLSALPFRGIGGVQPSVGMRPYADSGVTPPDLLDRLIDLGAAAGLDECQAWLEIACALEATEDYIDSAVVVLQEAVPPGYAGRAPDIQGFAATLREIRERLL